VRPSTSRRDSPALCALFGAILGMGALGLTFAWRLEMPNQHELRRVTGRVEQLWHSRLTKAGIKIHMDVRDRGSLHHLTQDDPSYAVPAMQTVRVGDSVVALVKVDSFGRDIEWLWALQRGDEQLLSYDQTLSVATREAHRALSVAVGAAVLSAILLVCSVVLRRHFGAWSSASQGRLMTERQ
jgi:hypothetical protein